jgi:hypothetical protein
MYNHRRRNDLHLHHVASRLNIAAQPSRIDSLVANMTRQLYHAKVNVVLVAPSSAWLDSAIINITQGLDAYFPD